MPSCQNCGNYISEEQNDNYMGFCQKCLQNSLNQSIRTEAANREITLCQMESCNSVAVTTCTKCGKKVCSRHAMSQKNNPYVIRCQSCGESANDSIESKRVFRICCSVLVIILSLIFAFI